MFPMRWRLNRIGTKFRGLQTLRTPTCFMLEILFSCLFVGWFVEICMSVIKICQKVPVHFSWNSSAQLGCQIELIGWLADWLNHNSLARVWDIIKFGAWTWTDIFLPAVLLATVWLVYVRIEGGHYTADEIKCSALAEVCILWVFSSLVII